MAGHPGSARLHKRKLHVDADRCEKFCMFFKKSGIIINEKVQENIQSVHGEILFLSTHISTTFVDL